MRRVGFPSPKYSARGVYFLSTGPDLAGPRPGPRVQAVIYDAEHRVVRRFEQIEGACVEEGYVDFFGSARCRPGRSRMPLVDIAPDGVQTTLVADFQLGDDRSVFQEAFRSWVAAYGVDQ